LQDSDYARPTKEARAQNDLACPIKEAKALDVKGINSKNTIIMHIPKGSNLVKGSKSRIICINFTSYIDLTILRKKDKIKAKKANRAKLRD
jgi:hypothetical protein